MSLRSTFARPAFRRTAVPIAAAGAIVLLAAPAFAHVTMDVTESAVGAYTVATFSVPHGCDGSPTTRIAIKVPDAITEVTPTRNAFYDIKTVTTKLNPPSTAEDGDAITEKVSRIVYTAKTPLPADERDTLELSFQVPEDAKIGAVLEFPTIQTCEQGQTAWVDKTPAGGEEPEHPAPAFTVTAATGESGHHAADTDDTPSSSDSDSAKESTAAVSSTSDDDRSSDALSWTALVAGALGLLAGGVAIIRSRKS